MQFRILRTELLNALTKVSRAVSSKSPLPVLTGIKFNLTNDELILTGSDSDITIETRIEKKEKKLEIYHKEEQKAEEALVEEFVSFSRIAAK